MRRAASRRRFLLGAGGALASGLVPATASGKVPVPYDWKAYPPMEPRSAFIDWMQVHRGEDPRFLAERTRGVYDRLIAEGYGEYRAIRTRNADGYYGWKEEASFDKIIVTCGIDHVPPPLLQQLKPNGIMVIPVGPPGAQHVLKVVKQQAADGSFTVARSDIYNGGTLSFVPFTKLQGGAISGTHSGG